MKKTVMNMGTILTLLLVLALGTGALAADVKIGGAVGYDSEIPTGDGYNSYDGVQYISYTLTFDAALSEQTSAKLKIKGNQDSVLGPRLARPEGIFTAAALQTKLNGLGTLSAGINPDYGTSPFAKIETFPSRVAEMNGVWGIRNSQPAIAFASEKFGALAGQVFFNPWSKDYGLSEVAGEVTYDLPVLAGATAGIAFNKRNDGDYTNWALIGNVAVTDNLTLYGEFGQVGGASDLNDKSLGGRAKLGAATLVAEAFLDETWGNGYYLQASYPFQDTTLSASYMFGDGLAEGSYYKGLLKLSAKVEF